MKFGFTKWSIVPVRAESREQSEMVTQLLFGDIFTVLKERKNWIYIQIEADQYEGWIDEKLFFEISADLFEQIKQSSIPVSKNLLTHLKNDSHSFSVLKGSSFPLMTNQNMTIGDDLYTIENFEETPKKNIREELVEMAASYLNTPYLWGGKSPFGIDCSGFSQMVYKINGIRIPRDASQQVNLGSSRNFIDEAEPGDLAFFDNEEGKVIHVGIVLAGRTIIHSSGQVRIDNLDHQGIYNQGLKAYTHKLRVIQNIIGSKNIQNEDSTNIK